MAIVFPASPSVNETFTAGSITYKWDGDKWIGLGVTPADRLVEGSNSLEIDANNNLKWVGDQLVVGDFATVDDRNGGGIHIQHSNGISFKSNSTQSVSRNWRIRGDDWGWGNLDFGVGDSVSDWSDSAADNVLSLTSSRNVGINNTNPSDALTVYKTNIGNPSGITIRNTEASSTYSHARLRLESQNGAAYGEIWADVANAGLRLGYNSSNTVKIDTNGNIVLLNGKGIDFSATSDGSGTSTSELLDDYEEGNWTPQWGSTIGSITNVTYNTQSGWYTKIGRLVCVSCRLRSTATDTSGAGGGLLVTGLPYVARTPQGTGAGAAYSVVDFPAGTINITTEVRENTTQFYAGLYTLDNGTFGNIGPGSLQSSGQSEIRVSFFYMTDS